MPAKCISDTLDQKDWQLLSFSSFALCAYPSSTTSYNLGADADAAILYCIAQVVVKGSCECESPISTLLIRMQLFTNPSIFNFQHEPFICPVYDLYTTWICNFILSHSAPDMFSNLTVSASNVRVIWIVAVCMLKGVPTITTGSLKSCKNGNPGMPIFTGCMYFHDTGPSGHTLTRAACSCVLLLQ